MYFHSNNNPINRINKKIDIVNFIDELKLDILNGKRRDTSISKIKKRIIIKKNCIEKDGIDGVCVKNPHSKVLHFCSLYSCSKLTVLVKIIMTEANANLIKTVEIIVISILFYDPHQYKFKYKNNHTTSTKCQYQAEHSNPVKCSSLVFIFFIRNKFTPKKVDPMITWRPWNPVAIKKVEPNTESAIENGASIYSNPCKAENNKPKKIVIKSDIILVNLFFFNNAWWHHVIDTPEDNNNKVFNKGMLIGLKAIISCGGQLIPNSTLGEILLWKNAQKKEVKNKTSEIINNNIPTWRPTVTCFLWFPCSIVSEKTFFHQLKEVKIKINNVNISVV